MHAGGHERSSGGATMGTHARRALERTNMHARGHERSSGTATMEPPARRRAAARTHGAPWNEGTCSYAAYGGHLAMLQWARTHGAPWDQWTCAHAAGGGHLVLLQWSRLLAGERLRVPTVRRGTSRRAQTRPQAVISRCCNGAACSQASGCACQRCAVGRVDVRICSQRRPSRGTAMEPPARRRAAARANDAPWNRNICAGAARGHPTVLQWMRANGAP